MYNLDPTNLIALLPKAELIELLECKLQCLQAAQREDSSWNYDIKGTEDEIKRLKSL